MIYNTSMRRVLSMLFILILISCRLFTPLPSKTPTAVPTTPSFEPTPSPTPTPLISATPTPVALLPPATAQPANYRVIAHPDGPLYVGDRVSFEVILSDGQPAKDASVSVSLTGAPQALGESKFDRFGMAGRPEAVLTWVWDTRGLGFGEHSLTFTVKPGGQSWTQIFTLLPSYQMPPREASATWAMARNQCCVIHYLTGSESERDLPELLQDVDAQAQDVETRMGSTFTKPVTITLMSRVLGNGGFATDQIMVSHLDRNYIGGETAFIIHHELVHILDARLGGDLRPNMLVEGLAVYITGGHFKPEPLMPRAATLLDSWGDPPTQGLGWYIPLATLADQFYTSQHEIGYLEAASVIEFMIQKWGQTAFSAFYRDIHPDSSGSQAKAIDTALVKHFNMTLSQFEVAFIDALKHEPPSQALLNDVRLSVGYFDTARRYQQDLDPSAYFLNAWIVDANRMRQLGITADYLRHPSTNENVALETMLIAAQTDMGDKRYPETNHILSVINDVLGAQEKGQPDPFDVDPLAADYDSIVATLRSDQQVILISPGGDVEPQRIQVDGNLASAWLDIGQAQLMEVNLEKLGELWRVIPATEGLFQGCKRTDAACFYTASVLIP